MRQAARTIHPADEEWLDYLKGAVTPAERSRMDEHLQACDPCRGALDDARMFLEPAERPVSKAALMPEPKVQPFAGKSNWLWLSAAACLAVALASQWIWSGREMNRWRDTAAQAGLANEKLRAELERARTPVANAEILDLVRAGANPRSAVAQTDQPRTLRASRPVLLVLPYRPKPETILELVDSSGKAVMRQAGFAVSATELRLLIPGGSLAAGKYDFALVEGETRTLLTPGLSLVN